MMYHPIDPIQKVKDSILRADNITKTFDGVTALHQVSFEINHGSIKALIGPNGAGKTTMLNIISGLFRASNGGIRFKDKNITKLKSEEISLLGVARTFQFVRLFTVNNATVLDNVMIGAHKKINPGILNTLFARRKMDILQNVISKRALELLDFVGLEGMKNSSPNTLSFSKQRMVELARALMAEPELLLLDEPASGLDENEVEKFKQLLSALRRKGLSILLVEHNMRLVMDIADEIIVLNFGSKIAEGNPSEVAGNPGVIDAYLGEDHLK